MTEEQVKEKLDGYRESLLEAGEQLRAALAEKAAEVVISERLRAQVRELGGEPCA